MATPEHCPCVGIPTLLASSAKYRCCHGYFIELNQKSLHCSRVKHYVLPLYGRFKSDRNLPGCYLFRIAGFLRSGFNMETWVSSRISEFENENKTTFLFADVEGKKDTVDCV